MREKIMALPEPQRLRVAALYQLFQKKMKLDEEFDKESDAIEKKYDDIEKPLISRQQEIIAGSDKPTEKELSLLPQMLKDDEADKLETLKAEAKAYALPDYYLKVFKNCDLLGE